ncbi:uncharacterized protein LOC119740564 [Patiria miniata]|uniref:Uncharacterized protein n=1 Tax=Patiria miniata TaxID=46514 RepID=A0A914B7P9_PATMI|nr:uncharacterized protein LOC119740564 [Patiria miniata]
MGWVWPFMLLGVALHLWHCTPVFSGGVKCHPVQINSSDQQVRVTRPVANSNTICWNATASHGENIKATMTSSTADCDQNWNLFSFEGLDFFETFCLERIEVFSPTKMLAVQSRLYSVTVQVQYTFESYVGAPVCRNGDHLCTSNYGSFCIRENTTCICFTDGYCFNYEGECKDVYVGHSNPVRVSEEVGPYSELMSGQVSNKTSCWAVPTLCCSLLY